MFQGVPTNTQTQINSFSKFKSDNHDDITSTELHIQNLNPPLHSLKGEICKAKCAKALLF